MKVVLPTICREGNERKVYKKAIVGFGKGLIANLPISLLELGFI